jgi:hypothetical protein
MKRLGAVRSVFFLLLWLALPLRGTGEDSQVSALLAADDARVAATIAADRPRLEAIFSDASRYAHSTGVVDTKESLIRALVGGQLKYLSIRPEQRDCTFPVADIALMTGRSQVRSATPAGGEVDVRLSYLAVSRREQGQWRFLAWQSCKLPSGERSF